VRAGIKLEEVNASQTLGGAKERLEVLMSIPPPKDRLEVLIASHGPVNFFSLRTASPLVTELLLQIVKQ
jgi:hypothetical protein